MRLSLKKAAHVFVSSAAYRKIRSPDGDPIRGKL